MVSECNTLPQNMTCHPQIHCFDILIILSCRHLKDKMQERTFPEFPYLPKDRYSKRKSAIIKLLPRSFINQERLTFVRGEETRSWCHTQPLPKTSYAFFWGLICLSKKLFTLPSKACITPPFSQLTQYVSLNTKPPQRVTHFCLYICHVCMRYTY